ncbi:fibronectin type III domain-containing protein [candidate division KSB1 bacterium]|nr:fibronectin type III domain-containing protein [candidate division KSB1 bacterium]
MTISTRHMIKNIYYSIMKASGRLVLLLLIIVIAGSTQCQKVHDDLVSPTDVNFPNAPTNLKATVNDGAVVLSWKITAGVSSVSQFYIYRKDSLDVNFALIDSSLTQTYTDSTVKNGYLYYYRVAAVSATGYISDFSKQVLAIPTIFDVIINNGQQYTNSENVTLLITSSGFIQSISIANDSAFQTSSGWETFSATKQWKLSTGDGLKHVYVKCKDFDQNEYEKPAHDTIILDTKAVIQSVTENTNGLSRTTGDVIHFRLVANETDGAAMIDIGTSRTGISLFDDGTNGDVLANDGIYELDYTIPPGLEVVQTIISGHFMDQVGNTAETKTATGKVTIQIDPNRVTLSPPVVSGTTTKSLELFWTQSLDDDFVSYRIFRTTSSGVDSLSPLLVEITNRNTTNFRDSNVKINQLYYYRIFVYDQVGNAIGSNEVSGKIDENPRPIAVTVFPVTSVSGDDRALSISWSRNDDDDFAYYKIYRAKDSQVDSSDVLVTSIIDQNNTSYQDAGLQINTTYYYRVYVTTNAGMSVGSNIQMGQTQANEAPLAVLLYPPSPVDGSFSQLSLSWSRSNDDDFASYKIFRSTTAGVDSTDLLITTISQQNTTNYEDSNLHENTAYYYRVYVYDTGGLAAGSNELMGRTNANEVPVAVNLYPPVPVGTSLTSLSLSWSRNNDDDFSSYKIYRSKTVSVDSMSALVTTITNQNTTSYEDNGLKENTEYYYRIYVYDEGGLAKGSNIMMGRTNANQKPAAISLIAPTPVTGSLTELNLSWSRSLEDDFESYRIYRSLDAGVDSTDYLVTTITNQATTTYRDNDLEENTSYHYRVYVYDDGGLASGSNEQVGTTNANEAPKAVTLYSPTPIVGSLTSVRLNWSKNDDSDFESYRIFRGEAPGVDDSNGVLVTTISNQSTNTYDDTGLEADTEYYYRIYVYDNGNLASGSNEQHVRTNANEAPEAVALAQPTVVDSTRLSLSWSRNNDDDFAMYSVYRSESSPVDTTQAPIAIINSQMTTSYADAKLTTNNTYYYRVFVKDTGGLIAGSNEVNGTPKP